MEATNQAHRDRASLETLTLLANDLAGEFRLRPLLLRVLRGAVQLLGCSSGSLCLIDQAAHSYRKEVDLDVGCQVGEVFSLDEGATGAVARAGRPVIFRRYADVPHPHVQPDEARYQRAVIGVPVRLRYDLIGSLIVFAAHDDQEFYPEDGQLLQRFATHAAIAIANSRLYDESAKRAQDAAVAAERERAMLEIHDTIGRSLASIMVSLGEARSAVRDDEAAVSAVDRAQLSVREALSESRRAVQGLGPSVLDRRSIDDSIRLELEWTQAVAGLTTNFRVFGDRRELAQEVTAPLLRIIQEALTNVVQHAHATHVRVGLVFGEEGVAAIVEDDGRGFEVSQQTGVGLSGLVARAAQIGGRLHVDSTPGWGTRVRVDLPFVPTPSQESAEPRLPLLVAHPQPALRAGLVRLVERAEPGVRVVAETATINETIDAVKLLRPAVLLMGQGWDAAEVIDRLRGVESNAAVVVVMDGPAPEAELVESASMGVRGFVSRDADATALGRAVLAAARGDVVVFGGPWQQLGGVPAPPVRLTPRETEVRALLAMGLADKQIASRLGIAVKTVEKHVSSILRKEHVRSRTELLARE